MQPGAPPVPPPVPALLTAAAPCSRLTPLPFVWGLVAILVFPPLLRCSPFCFGAAGASRLGINSWRMWRGDEFSTGVRLNPQSPLRFRGAVPGEVETCWGGKMHRGVWLSFHPKMGDAFSPSGAVSHPWSSG